MTGKRLDSFRSALREAGEALTAATAETEELETQSQRLAAAVTTFHERGAAGHQCVLEELTFATARSTGQLSAATTTAQETNTLVDAWNGRKANTLGSFAESAGHVGTGLHSLSDAAARLVADVLGSLNELTGSENVRCELLLRQAQESTSFLDLMVREERAFQRALMSVTTALATQAEGRAERRRRQDQADALRLTLAGCRALKTANLTAAEMAFRRAHALVPSAATTFNLALVLLLGGRLEQAAARVREATMLGCSAAETHALRALEAWLRGDYSLAHYEAAAGLQLSPRHPALHALAGAALARSGSAAAALRCAASDATPLGEWTREKNPGAEGSER